MIVCSCAVVSDRDIREAVRWMRAADPYAVVTPGKVYRALGRQPVCGGCISLFVATMRVGIVPEGRGEVPAELRTLRVSVETEVASVTVLAAE